MSDQIRIGDSGGLDVEPAGPLTWDGEPLFSPATVREGLFTVEAFEQLPRQLALEVDDER